MLDVLQVSFSVIDSLREPMVRIERLDRDLARQIRRAASSISLNLAEGRRRTGRDRIHSFRIAHGSASEVRAALRVAAGWGYVPMTVVESLDADLDRICAMCWRLTEG